MIELYLIFWPRHSLLLPAVLVIVSLWLYFCRHRYVAASLLVLAVLCTAWYGQVNWRTHALPTGQVIAVDIETLDRTRRKTVDRPDQIAEVCRAFEHTSVRTGRFKVTSQYRLTLRHPDGSCVRYRLTRNGFIARDVPASAIQDVYIPQTPIPPSLLPEPGE